MTVKVRQAFPSLPVEFFDILSDRVKENGFSDQRLKDSVTNVIDNCIYPTPTIAQFISFDKRFKIYTYDQVLKLNDELSGKAFEYYRPTRHYGFSKPAYAHISDIEKYKLTPWNEK